MLREIAEKVTNTQPPDSVVVQEVDWTAAESLDIFRRRYPTIERYRDKTGRWIFRLIAPDLCNEHRVQGGDWPASFTHYFPSDHPDKKRGFAGHFGPSLTAFLNTENRLRLLKEGPSMAEEKETANLLQMLYNMGSAAEVSIRARGLCPSDQTCAGLTVARQTLELVLTKQRSPARGRPNTRVTSRQCRRRSRPQLGTFRHS
jgi:hypothetical protein